MLKSNDIPPILDAILEGFQVLDRDWRYVHVNDAAARHGRTDKADLLGRRITDCYPGIDQTEVFARMRQAMLERSSHVLENEFKFPDGGIGHFELRIEPVPHGICVLSIDITARKLAEAARITAEERLRHGQRMESLGHLAAGVAHDFNNLLTVIINQGELALAEKGRIDAADAAVLLDAARSSAGLTRQLLAYGRRAPLVREVVDLREAVRGLTALLRRSIGSGIELGFELDADTEPVDIDRSYFEQILLNLVLNAQQAIADKDSDGIGRITVKVGRAELDEDYVARHPGACTGPHALLSVCDTGGGMTAEVRRRLFEPYFSTKQAGRGTGLGLATVYGIVRQHGGNIWVYSELDKGTSIKIYLPRSAATPAPRVAVPDLARAPRRAATVLVVDDTPEVARVIARILGTEQHRVIVTENGEQALAALRQQEQSIDLVITDFMMPGMSGSQLVRRLRATAKNLPVICTSGYSGEHVGGAHSLPKDVLLLEKPFSPVQLLAKVHQALANIA